MLDTYIHGTVSRISPEAPVPIFIKTSTTNQLGGAGNVLKNIHAFGADSTLVSVIGDKAHANYFLMDLLPDKNSSKSIFVEMSRKTTQKVRFVGNNYQLLRVDDEDTKPINEESEQQVIDFIDNHINEYKLVLIADYNKGVLTNKVISTILSNAHFYKIPVFVDPKTNLNSYIGASLIKPNRRELEAFCGVSLVGKAEIVEAAERLSKELNIRNVLITLGEEGMYFYKQGKYNEFIKPHNGKGVFDVAGAGDTVLSAIAVAFIRNYSFLESIKIANKAASIVVGKPGTSIVNREEMEIS